MSVTRYCLILIFNCVFFIVYTQTSIVGSFPPLAGKIVRLVGFRNIKTYSIDSTIISNQGDFILKFSNQELGMGFIITEDNESILLLLSQEKIRLKGENFSNIESINVLSGNENQLLVKYIKENSKREQVLNAWLYLKTKYQTDSLFSIQKKTVSSIESEIKRIKNEDNDFLNTINSKSYLSWFLPIRKLVNSVSTIAQYRTDEISETLTSFRNLDYSDDRFYNSGLLKDAIESQFWLLENMGQSLDIVYKEMCISIDYLVTNLSKDEKKFNEITKYLFNLLERQSLFQASEYLSIKLLTQNSCTINNDFKNQLESYRKMKIGNVAQNIIFSGDVFKNGLECKSPKNLTEILTPYKVVIFGASWCQKCSQELSQLLQLYPKWKEKGVEVVFISLDFDKNQFKNFSGILPFISMCDYMKWENKAVTDYQVFATPTFFLLDKDQKIILRPNSINQLDSWVDYFLK